MKKIFLLLVCFATTATCAFADKPISVDQLPVNGKQFIQKYFADVKVAYAKIEKELLETSYEVVFVDGNKVEFDKQGEWEEVDCKFTQVPAGVVPQKIQDYVTANYKEVKILKIERDSKKYEIKLSNKLELKFDAKFNLVAIDD